MTQTKKDFLILYGSQTGQAQAISEEIFDRAHKEGFNPRRLCLSQVEKKFSLVKESLVVFVCSTTGEGDAPDTAVKFFRRLKKKTLPNNHLEHLNYAFLALGDSNYTNFCNCGKSIDARLLQLSAKHFYDTGYADDAVGLEVVVEPWIENLFPALRKHVGIVENGIDTPDKVNEIPQTSEEQKILDDIKNAKIEKDEANTETIETAAVENHIEDVSTLHRSIGPLSTAALKIPSCPDAYLEIKFLDDGVDLNEKNDSTGKSHPSAETDVYEVPIVSARRLTNDPLVKKALELKLDGSKVDFDFKPGDSFGIVCQNRASEVDYLVRRLGFEETCDRKMTLEILKDTKKKAPTIPEHIKLPSTLRNILTNDTDFRAVPRKAFLRMMVDYTEDPSEKRRLQELASVQGSKDYAAFIREQNVGLIELLKTFKTCKPPIQRILEFLPRLLPREYSVANSPLDGTKCISFVFNVIQLPDFDSGQRFGLCTKHLDLITRNLRKEASEDEVIESAMQQLKIDADDKLKVKMYFRKPTNFRFPDDPSRPLIMIGPGTGVAPFIGFLEHRAHIKKMNPEMQLGKAVLFFGCRYRDKDFLYRDEITKFLGSGILDQLHTSFSRDETSNDEPHTKYVQENIRICKDDLLTMIFENNGAVFICGDAKHMGRDVTNTFVELVEEYKNIPKLDAIKILDGLRKTKQFLEDVWT